MTGRIHPDGSESEGRALSRVELELRLLKQIGNAYHNHGLLMALPNLAIEAAAANGPDLAFEALDYLGTKVRGLDPLIWDDPHDGFEINLRCALENIDDA